MFVERTSDADLEKMPGLVTESGPGRHFDRSLGKLKKGQGKAEETGSRARALVSVFS